MLKGLSQSVLLCATDCPRQEACWAEACNFTESAIIAIGFLYVCVIYSFRVNM